MESIQTLLLCCVLLNFKKFTFCEEKFEVKVFKSITTAPMRNDGSMIYIKRYPEADTDQYAEERRLQLCRTGFDYVSKHEKGKHFLLTEHRKPLKLEAYVLVNPSALSDDEVEVRPAYPCPTIPPTYIHVNCDYTYYGGEEPKIWVIFKDSGPSFNFNLIKEYHLIISDEIREADAEEITATSGENVGSSAFDDDKLSADQKLQICERVMNMAPEIDAHFLKDIEVGKSKYYAFIDSPERESVEEDVDMETKSEEIVGNKDKQIEVKQSAFSRAMTRTSQDLDSENDQSDIDMYSDDSEDSEDTESSESDNLILQAFTCPTSPKIWVNVTFMDERENSLWAVVRRNEIKEHPSFNLMVYELIIVSSIHKLSEEFQISNKNEHQNDPQLRNESLEDNSRRLNEKFDALITQGGRTRSYPMLDSLVQKYGKKDADIDIDEISVENCLLICEKAVKTVLGEKVEFTKDGASVHKDYYRFFKNQEQENLDERNRVESGEIVKLFTCPTKPAAYIHLATQFIQNIGQVIITKSDMASLSFM